MPSVDTGSNPVPTQTSVELTPVPATSPDQSGEQQPAQISKETTAPELSPESWQPDPENPMPAIQMTEFADIIGKYTGSTAIFKIPYPYWEISYNITPSGQNPNLSDGCY